MTFERVLITGCAGFLGKMTVSEFLGASSETFGIDTAVPEGGILYHLAEFWHGSVEENIGEVVRSLQPDTLVHLAGSASVPASISNPYEDFSSLVPGTARLCEAVGKYSPHTKVILISSAAVYGQPVSLPIGTNAARRPVSPYGVHKVAAENICKGYSDIYGFPIKILRVFSAFGVGLRKQIFWDIATKVRRAEMEGAKSIELLGTGMETRDFISGQDVARAIRLISENMSCTTSTAINIANGREVLVKDAAELLVSRMAPELKVRFSLKKRSGDPDNWLADIAELESLSFARQKSFEDEIAELACWLGKCV